MEFVNGIHVQLPRMGVLSAGMPYKEPETELREAQSRQESMS